VIYLYVFPFLVGSYLRTRFGFLGRSEKCLVCRYFPRALLENKDENGPTQATTR